MGTCASAPTGDEKEREKTKEIDLTIDRLKEKENEILKLLLLGAGESGKSTLFKQMIQIYGKGFDDGARALYTALVFSNTLLSMKQIIQQSRVLPETLNTRMNPKVEVSAKFIEEMKIDAQLDTDVASHIKYLWEDPGVKATWANRHMYQLTCSDGCHTFFDSIMDIGKKGYLPSYNDVLRVRARTTGIVETSFECDGTMFTMVDVGGQRNERRKWFHCFSGVTAVIFVAAISEYDQVLYEDNKKNRMVETLDLFEEICNSKWFSTTSTILFLNKEDLFREKITRVDMKCCFPEYKGGSNFDIATNFLKEEFIKRNHAPGKEIYVHVTCATDTYNIEFTFNAVKDILVRRGLEECGLLT